MKKLIILSVLASLVFTDCGRKKHTAKKNKEGRIEIVPFYRNKVFVKDLNLIDTNLYLVEPEEFLTKAQLKNLTDAMWSVVRNPGAEVFTGNFMQAASSDDLKERFIRCDSVIPVDSLDNQIGKAFLSCDSTTIMDGVSLIYFFESWYLNPKTNLIEIETLGYSVWSYVPFKEAFKETFLVFRNKEAVEKSKKYYFSY